SARSDLISTALMASSASDFARSTFPSTYLHTPKAKAARVTRKPLTARTASSVIAPSMSPILPAWDVGLIEPCFGVVERQRLGFGQLTPPVSRLDHMRLYRCPPGAPLAQGPDDEADRAAESNILPVAL